MATKQTTIPPIEQDPAVAATQAEVSKVDARVAEVSAQREALRWKTMQGEADPAALEATAARVMAGQLVEPTVTITQYDSALLALARAKDQAVAKFNNARAAAQAKLEPLIRDEYLAIADRCLKAWHELRCAQQTGVRFFFELERNGYSNGRLPGTPLVEIRLPNPWDEVDHAGNAAMEMVEEFRKLSRRGPLS